MTPDWSAAACRTVDGDLFFPEVGGNTASAKAVCRGCPIIHECGQYAITHRLEGVWGGTSNRERAKLTGLRTRVRVDRRG